jgi:hypothetical protein
VTVSNVILTRFGPSIIQLSFTEKRNQEDDLDNKVDEASVIEHESDDEDEDKNSKANQSKVVSRVPSGLVLSSGHSISASEITCSPPGSEASTRAAFVRHETSLGNIPDLKKARQEVAHVVRSKIFKSTKFTSREDMFEYVPTKDNEKPMRGIFYRILLGECKHRGGNDNIWWDAVKKVVKTTISKKRTTVAMALKKAFICM